MRFPNMNDEDRDAVKQEMKHTPSPLTPFVLVHQPAVLANLAVTVAGDFYVVQLYVEQGVTDEMVIKSFETRINQEFEVLVSRLEAPFHFSWLTTVP